MRYVQKRRQIYDFSRCKRCGTGWGTGCTETTCMFCGTTQCLGNGLGRGQCSICYHGFLNGWVSATSAGICTYKGCGKPAVGSFPRKGRCCAEHGLRCLKDPDYITKRLLERDKNWELVA